MASINGSHGCNTNPWFPLLQRFHQARTPRPCCRTAAQQFMVSYSDVVHTAFISQHSDGKNLSNTQRMNFHSDLARKMVSGQYSHLVQELEKKATNLHKKEHRVQLLFPHGSWSMRCDKSSWVMVHTSPYNALYDP